MSYIGNQPTVGQYRKLDDISGSFNGSLTAFTMQVSSTNVTAGSAFQLLISLGGVIQEPGTDFTVSGSTITFTTAPAASLSFFGIMMGQPLNTATPGDSTVTGAKIVDGTITGGKLAAAFNYDSGLLFLDDTNNRVAIGTTSPTALFQIHDGPLLISKPATGSERDWRFLTSNAATGDLSIQQSTTAGGTTYDTKFHVSAAGNVGIGTTSPASDALLTLQGTNRNIFFQADGAPTDCAIDCSGGRFVFRGGSSGTTVASISEQMRLDENGRLLIGTTSSSSNSRLVLQGTSLSATGEAVLRFARGEATPANGTSTGAIIFTDSSQGEGGLINGARDGGTWSASSKPTRLLFSTCADGSSTPTERMRISQDGGIQMLQNGGALLINTTTTLSAHKVGIAGNSQTVLYCDRKGNDGNLLTFFRDASEVGVISVSSGTVSYGGGHISRWSQLPNNAERTEILMGSVLSNLDEMCVWAYDAEPEVLWEEGDELPEGVQVGDVKTPARPAGTEDNIQLNRMKVSDVEGDPNVAGVFQNWDDDDDTYTNDFFCAMTGDFVIRIAEGVTVERGDLLMSAGDGTAKPQDDDIIRSKTIAKVTSTNVSCTYADGSFCVPCVLMAC